MTSLGVTCRHGKWLTKAIQSTQNVTAPTYLKFSPRSVAVSESWKTVAAFSYHSSSRNHFFQSLNKQSAKQDDDSREGEDTAETTSGTVDKAEFEKLEKELADHKAQIGSVTDKYRRAIAENDNMRKRLTKQIEDAKIYGIQGFCKDLLDVADVLAKAVDAGKAIENEVGNKDMIDGVKLTQTQLLQVFNRHGLTQISPVVGEDKFDPNVHEALFQIPAPDKEENIVLDVQKIGYSLHGRTIRPALVGVSKK